MTNENNNTNTWIGGVVIVTIGLIFLLNNTSLMGDFSYWPLFMFIPVIVMWIKAFSNYRTSNTLTPQVITPFFIGLIISVQALIFLLDLSWFVMWPIQMIIIGLWILVRRSGIARPDEVIAE